MVGESVQTVDRFFTGRPGSRRLFAALRAVIEQIGPAGVRVTRSQIAFSRKTAFPWAWVPGKYLRKEGAPLVLSVSLRRKDRSPRWKEIVQPTRGRYMHRLELYCADQLDDQVRDWLREAWAHAG